MGDTSRRLESNVKFRGIVLSLQYLNSLGCSTIPSCSRRRRWLPKLGSLRCTQQKKCGRQYWGHQNMYSFWISSATSRSIESPSSMCVSARECKLTSRPGDEQAAVPSLDIMAFGERYDDRLARILNLGPVVTKCGREPIYPA